MHTVRTCIFYLYKRSREISLTYCTQFQVNLAHLAIWAHGTVVYKIWRVSVE